MTSFADWRVRGLTLARRDHDTPWELGEWWASGKAWSRERITFVKTDPAYRGPPVATLHNYATTYRKFKDSVRESLSLTHHDAVAMLAPAKAYELLAEAHTEGWTVPRLRIAAKQAKNFRSNEDFEGCAFGDLDQAVRDRRTFPTILADPPWRFLNETAFGPNKHYLTMPTEELCAMPVAKLAAQDAHLHLWCPAGLLPDGLAVMEAWGFEYRDRCVWKKPDVFGTGSYYRHQTEELLLGVRGKATRFLDGSTPDWFEAPRGKHSEKPAIVHDMIMRCSPGPFLELFARQEREGWAVWGDQVPKKQFQTTAIDRAGAVGGTHVAPLTSDQAEAAD